jgi:pyruvate/2-oxoglutarate/acetoin dehydrogenase E1 component
MFGDFLTLTFDQILNHMVKFRTMYGKQLPVPLVLRTPMGGGRGYGATHSQSIEKHFLGIPDLNVVAASVVHDAGALLRHAILNDDGPVVFIEHKLLYPAPLFGGDAVLSVSSAGDGPYDTRIVRNFRSGNPDCVVIGYGGMSRHLLDVARSFAEEEINLSIVLPSLLSPMHIAPIVAEVGLCGRAIVVEEGTEGFGWGAQIAAGLYERLFGKLKRPVAILASRPEIIPTSFEREAEILLNRGDIENAILKAIE